MTDLIDQQQDPAPQPAEEPPAETPVAEPVGPVRTLTPEEADAYASRLATVGFTFTPSGVADDPSGFDVRADDGSVSYGYRYDATASTAVALMERVCAERGC